MSWCSSSLLRLEGISARLIVDVHKIGKALGDYAVRDGTDPLGVDRIWGSVNFRML